MYVLLRILILTLIIRNMIIPILMINLYAISNRYGDSFIDNDYSVHNENAKTFMFFIFVSRVWFRPQHPWLPERPVEEGTQGWSPSSHHKLHGQCPMIHLQTMQPIPPDKTFKIAHIFFFNKQIVRNLLTGKKQRSTRKKCATTHCSIFNLYIANTNKYVFTWLHNIRFRNEIMHTR